MILIMPRRPAEWPAFMLRNKAIRVVCLSTTLALCLFLPLISLCFKWSVYRQFLLTVFCVILANVAATVTDLPKHVILALAYAIRYLEGLLSSFIVLV